MAGDAEQHKEQRQKPSSGPSERTRAAAAQAARARREGRQRPKDEPEPEPEQAEASEQPAADSTQDESDSEQPAPRPSWRRRSLMALPMIIAGIALIGYFVWLCLEMSSAAPFGGSALPAGIFGGVIVGGLAGVAGIKSAR